MPRAGPNVKTRDLATSMGSRFNAMTAPVFEFGHNTTCEEDIDYKGAYFLLHSNLKIFSRAIHALSKLGSDLYLEPSVHGLSLKSFSKNKSAYGIFLFANDFFSETDYSQLANATNNITLCRISMRCATSIFKGIQFVDKNFMSFKMWIDPRADTLVVEIVHAYDLAKTMEIHVMENRAPFKTTVDKNKLANITVASAETFMSLLALLRSQSEELIITARGEELTFKNYCSKDNQENTNQIVKTEAHVRLEDLIRHQVARPTEITFSLKEFMAILSFAASHQSPISLYYDSPGKPLVVALEGDVSYTSEFIIATFENAYSEAEDSGQLEVRTVVTDSRSRSRRSEAQSERQQAPSRPTTQLNTRINTAYQPVTATELPSRGASVENPYLTPIDSNLLDSGRQTRQEPVVADAEFLDDEDLLTPNTFMENLGFDGFTTSTQRLAEDQEDKEPSPKRPRDKAQFRRYFLSFDEATQKASQASHDESVIAYDSFDEESL